ncbi:MAG: hypothetical protein LBM70_07315 [Victivallales bacterium]|jgi:hypothetical protein|nr:hypothetical protein [Victivallales bacterium]
MVFKVSLITNKATILAGILLILLVGNVAFSRENLQYNSSFEHAGNPDLPDYFFPMGVHAVRSNGLVGTELSLKTIAELEKKVALDDTNAFDGQKSFRVEKPFFIGGMAVSVIPGQDYAISVYLRAEKPNTLVRLEAVDNRRDRPFKSVTLKITTKWKRYSLALPKYPKNKLAILIVPTGEGKLWADAVQIEAGTIPSTYQASPLDERYKFEQPMIHLNTMKNQILPEISLGESITQAPQIDGALGEECWEKAPSVFLNSIMGGLSCASTEVKLRYDAQNIYLGFICKDPQKNKGRGESLEIFLDFWGTGNPFYQFILPYDGEKFANRSSNGKHEFKYPIEWNAKVQPNTDGWTAEIQIPLSQFPEKTQAKQLSELRMNFARNYPGGPEVYLSWTPMQITFLEPEHFGFVKFGEAQDNPKIIASEFRSTNPQDQRFAIETLLHNSSSLSTVLFLLTELETTTLPLQSSYSRVELSSKEKKTVTIDNLKIENSRIRLIQSLFDENGQLLQKKSNIRYVQQPLKVFSEYSYYTSEKEAKIHVETAPYCVIPDGSKLTLQLRLPPLSTVLSTHTYSFNGREGNFSLPLNQSYRPHHFRIEAILTAPDGSTIGRQNFSLIRRSPRPNEVKINRLNRIPYVNGKPFFAYGYQVHNITPETIEFLKANKMDYVSYVGHWVSLQTNQLFLDLCDKNDIKVMNSYLIRSYALSPSDFLGNIKDHPSLFAVNPVDESDDDMLPEIVHMAQTINPYIINYRNDNVATYNYWRKRLYNSSPGDVGAFDRYPFVVRPDGMPHIVNSMLYTVERFMHLMDAESREENIPSFCWMQASETFSRELNDVELTYLHYAALINNCVGFTYFAGVPYSSCARNTIKRLNGELKEIEKYIVSTEKPGQVNIVANERNAEIIFMVKQLNHELLIIALNRAAVPVRGKIKFDKKHIDQMKSDEVEVLFENRTLKIKADGEFDDEFPAFGRHVYRIPSKKQ